METKKSLITLLAIAALIAGVFSIISNESYACYEPPPPPCSPAPGVFSLSAPDDGYIFTSTENIVLEWDVSSNADYYNIYLAEDGESLEYQDNTGSQTWSVPPSLLECGKTYNWRIIAVNTGSGCTATSRPSTETWSFKVLEIKNTRTETLYSTIQAAIDEAIEDDTIEANVGTYEEKLNFNDKKITLTSTDPDDPEIVAATIIDGCNSGTVSVVTFDSGDANSTITGFTITNGNCSSSQGGGMHISSCDPNIFNCVFSENGAVYGGGIYVRDSNCLITNCTFSKNIASNTWDVAGGGGICVEDCNCLITNCTFSENTGDNGGGIYNLESSPTVTDCNFIGNIGNIGGGMGNDACNVDCTPIVTNCIFKNNRDVGMLNLFLAHPTVTNCLFIGNTGCYGGGGIFNDNRYYDLLEKDGELLITNCTFIGNGTCEGGAIIDSYPCDNMAVVATNCIFWDNSDGTEDQVRSGAPLLDETPIALNYCCIQAGWQGNNNTNDDPELDEDDDWHLTSGSPCIDVGDNGGDYTGQKDLDGDERVIDVEGKGNWIKPVDIGVDEYDPS